MAVLFLREGIRKVPYALSWLLSWQVHSVREIDREIDPRGGCFPPLVISFRIPKEAHLPEHSFPPLPFSFPRHNQQGVQVRHFHSSVQQSQTLEAGSPNQQPRLRQTQGRVLIRLLHASSVFQLCQPVKLALPMEAMPPDCGDNHDSEGPRPRHYAMLSLSICERGLNAHPRVESIPFGDMLRQPAAAKPNKDRP